MNEFSCKLRKVLGVLYRAVSPTGTPPTAIVFGSGYVTIPRMAKTGVLLDVAAAAIAAAWCWLVAGALFGGPAG